MGRGMLPRPSHQRHMCWLYRPPFSTNFFPVASQAGQGRRVSCLSGGRMSLSRIRSWESLRTLDILSLDVVRKTYRFGV